MFNQLKLKYGIFLGYLVLLLLVIVAYTVGYISTLTVAKQGSITYKYNQTLIKINKLCKQISKMQRSARDYLIVKNDTSLRHFEEAVAEYNETSLFLAKMINDPTQKKNLQKLSDCFKKIEEVYRAVIILEKEDKKEQATQLFIESKAIDLSSEIENLGNKFEKRGEEILQAQKSISSSTVSILENFVILGTIFTIVFSIGICLMISSSISKTITKTINAIASTSTEFATTVAQYEGIASHQVTMVNEITTSINELGSSSKQLAEYFKSAITAVQKISSLTNESNEIFKQTIESMTSLKDKVRLIADQMLKIGEQYGQIVTVAELVKDIATQINMLGLMQTVEAARVGENGKEFAVSASEVRKLAVENKKFAEQIKTIVSEIQKSTNSTTMTTEEGTSKVEEVTKLSYKIEDFFYALTESINLLFSNSQQALLNSRQQSVAINQVVSAINTINSGAKETASGISQTKIGIQKLNQAAQKLKKMV